eukprot:jgi/Chrzof1/4190/Cz14g02100.t1
MFCASDVRVNDVSAEEDTASTASDDMDGIKQDANNLSTADVGVTRDTRQHHWLAKIKKSFRKLHNNATRACQLAVKQGGMQEGNKPTVEHDVVIQGDTVVQDVKEDLEHELVTNRDMSVVQDVSKDLTAGHAPASRWKLTVPAALRWRSKHAVMIVEPCAPAIHLPMT